jgi:uncharacterized protein
MTGSKRILIAGGSGLIGTRLTEMLQSRGYEVVHLGRKKRANGVKTFLWDVKKMKLDPNAFEKVSVVINLAGEGVADRRWSAERKKAIRDSRTQSTALLFNYLSNNRHEVKSFISASGIGYYGAGDASIEYTEDDSPGNDFLAGVTIDWEKEVQKIIGLGIRAVVIRIGVVLSDRGGALEPFVKAVKALVGAPLGSGLQYMSWIHIDDLCRIFIKAVETSAMTGVFNAVASTPVTNREFTVAVSKELNKPLIFPGVPAFVLKIIFGEMGSVALEGAKVSNTKIKQTGFTFQFDSLPAALENLLRRTPGQ